MLNPEDIHPALVLRLINSHTLGAPVGALATVQTVEQSLAGNWMCTVTWQDMKALQRGPLLRSYLWAVDLTCFEIVNDLQRAVAKQVTKAESMREAKRAQLRLPFEDSGA